ncbi:hypothetical protein Hanom_Chr04g00369611 [Helianthus anomalus]
MEFNRYDTSLYLLHAPQPTFFSPAPGSGRSPEQRFYKKNPKSRLSNHQALLLRLAAPERLGARLVRF